MSPAPIQINPQIFEADSTLDQAFNTESLSSAEREQVRRLSEAMKALLLKGLFHRVRPHEFPLTSNQESLESRAAASIRAIAPQRFSRMRPKIEALINDPARVAAYLGSSAHLNLRKPDLDSDIQQIFPVLPGQPTPNTPQPLAQQAPKFNRLTLVLRKIGCVDETDPEGGADDDIIMGGIRIGASGNIATFDAFVAGHFDDGEYQDFGAIPLGTYSLKTTPGYPKLFFCIFLLVESDSDDEEVAQDLTKGLELIASVAVALAGYGALLPLVHAVFTVIGDLLGAFIDDDYFPPYGIQLKLKSENDFGSSGTGPNQHTGNISAHGGTYRIGYRWELSA
jgi:hypothetical protein